MTDFVFHPSAVLSFETVEGNDKRFSKKLAARKNLISASIDLAKVTRCDSTGLAFLIAAKRLCQQRQIIFNIENMSETVKALVKFCGVNEVILE